MEEYIELFKYLVGEVMCKEYPIITRYEIDGNVPNMEIIFIRIYVSGYISYNLVFDELFYYKKLVNCRYFIHLDDIVYE